MAQTTCLQAEGGIMARVTYVKKARQRYATVPVIDPATGEPKRTPVMRNGKQRTTKSGKPITMAVTQADKSKPLPPLTCDFCGKPIKVGQAYKHITPKSGPYGGVQRNRHAEHPTWQVWEYSYSLSAQIARIQHDGGESLADVDTTEDMQDALNSVAEEVRGLAEEKRQGAENIREGFGHDTYQAEELDETADTLEGWADELESWEPSTSEPEQEDEDTWDADAYEDFEEAHDDWADDARSEASDLVDQSPV
jgi:hypothetical protein